jgi:polysaccharide biosynthesis/export protein
MPEVASSKGSIAMVATRGLGSALALLLGSALPVQPLATWAAAPSASAPASVTRPSGAGAQVDHSGLQDDPYILGPGDQLDLKLYDVPDLSTKLVVLSDGTVSLPLVGIVRVQGLTLSQAEQWFTSLFRKQLQRPQLQLSVAQPRPIRVALVGEVERPGVYSLTTSEISTVEGASNQISGLPTLVDSLQKAGGITLNADLRQVVLQRRLPGDRAQFKRVTLDLLQLLREGDQLQNPMLFDGDTIRVARAEQPVAEAIEVASANFSPQQIQVFVVGEVVRPGPVQVAANTPLIQGVLAAGGPQFGRANQSNVELVRINRNGSVFRQRFRLDLGQGASNAKNPPLRDGDTVLVNRSGLALVSDSIGAISQPLSGLVNIWALVQLIQDQN